MNEILKYKGRLAVKELEAKSLRTRIKGDIVALRDLLDPFVPEEKLQADVIAEQAFELANKHITLKEVLAEIEAIKEALGS